MNFSFLNRKQNHSAHDVYCGILLKETSSEILLLSLNEKTQQAKVIDAVAFKLTNGWDNIVDDVDSNLYELEKKHEVRCEKAIFFLYSHMVDQATGKILDHFLKNIKLISKELELDPAGYVEYHEAIAKICEITEDAPLSALIIEIDTKDISVFLYAGGQLLQTAHKDKTSNFIEDVESLISQIKGHPLPTRIIMYDSDSLSEESLAMTTHNWGEDLFLQIPHVETLSQDRLRNALVGTFAAKLYSNALNVDFATHAVSEPEIEKSTDEAEFTAEEQQTNEPDNEDSLKNSGFAIDSDIATDPEAPVEGSIPITPENETSRNIAKGGALFVALDKFKSKMKNLSSADKSGKFKILIPILVIFLIFVVLALVYSFHKAELTLLFDAPKVEKLVTIDASTTDNDEDVLPMKKGSTTITASSSTKTTGEDTKGEKAKGKVTVINLDEKERTFSSGTVLKTSSGLTFLLDETVTVASAESSITSGGDVTITTGKKSASATAEKIGEESNIKKDTELSIVGVSSASARSIAETDFTGGSSQDVQTVSESDIESIKTKVEKTLKDKAEETIGKVSNEETIIDSLTQVTGRKDKFSKKLGEEATTIALESTGTVSYYSYEKDQLKKLIAMKLASEIGEGNELKDEDLKFEIEDVNKKKKGDGYTFVIKVDAQPVPKIATSDVVKATRGKSKSEVESIVKQGFKAEDFLMKVESPLSLLNSRMPFFDKHIVVKVDTQ